MSASMPGRADARQLAIATLVAAAMLVVALGTEALRARTATMSPEAAPSLEQTVPVAFGEWTEVDTDHVRIVNPEIEETVAKAYSQVVTRTYRNATGYRVMLSVAYGQNQSRALQVHRPEVCFAAQGFAISGLAKRTLAVASVRGGELPVMQLVARIGPRIEPVTYWLRIGSGVARGNVEQGLARVSHGLKGIPFDGLVFRVSSLDADTAEAFAQQAAFVSALLGGLPEAGRAVLVGGSMVAGVVGTAGTAGVAGAVEAAAAAGSGG